MSNFMSNENATPLFTKIGNMFRKRPSTFTGTTAQWNALTAEEKAQYEIVNITDDYNPSGGGGGHTIQDAAGNNLEQRETMQFKGGLKATDDSTNGKTLIDDSPEEYTWEEWNELTSEEQEAIPKALITNIPRVPVGVSITAAQVAYNNTVTELTATNVQAAIDEIASRGGGGLLPRLYIHSDTGATTVRAVKDTITIPATETSTSGLFSCDLPEYGDWTVYGVVDGDNVQTTISITTVKEYEVSFMNGSTATPVNDVTILLECAGIYDSEITTINELLEDDTTLLTVISSNNAINYLVRSTNFATAISQNQTAMGYIGLDDYASNTLLADSTWVVAIGSSGYSELVLNVKNPNMTSASTPSGRVNGTGTWSTLDAYKAFDGSQTSYALFNSSTMWVYYQFAEPVKICKITLKNNGRSGEGDNWQYFIKVFKIQGSNDGNNWTDLFSGQTTAQAGSTSNSFYFNNTDKYLYYRIVRVSAWGDTASTCIGELTYYGRKDV